MLLVSFQLRLRRVCKENLPPAGAEKKYKARVKSLGKKVHEEKLNGMGLLLALKQSKQKIERLECEKKLPQQIT